MNIFKNLSKGVSTLSMIGILALSFGAQAETSDKYQQAAGFYRQMEAFVNMVNTGTLEPPGL